MHLPDWIAPLFRSIDTRDADAFAAHLAEDGVFRYGSQPAVAGRAAVREHVAGFFSGLQGLSHELDGFWWGEPGALCFAQGRVTYHLAGETRVTLPFLNLYRLRDGLIAEYLVFADPSPLFQPA